MSSSNYVVSVLCIIIKFDFYKLEVESSGTRRQKTFQLMNLGHLRKLDFTVYQLSRNACLFDFPSVHLLWAVASIRNSESKIQL